MHGTVQLVAARDAPGLRHVVQPALHDELLARHGERLRGVALNEVARVTRELLEDTPRTIADLGAELAARWPDVPVTSLTASSAPAWAANSASSVLAFAFLMRFFTLEKASSMGFP